MSPVRKAVIPAAGLGTRFLPATKAQPKEMLPVVDRPAIQYVVEEAVGAGIEDILIVTGRNKKAIEDHFDRAPELEAELEAKGKQAELDEVRRLSSLADIHYVRQGEALGLGHAVAAARRHVGDDSFCVLLGDDFMDGPSTLQSMIDAHDRLGRSVVALLEVPHEDIRLYGCADVDPAGVPGEDAGVLRIRGLVEKPAPEQAPSNYAVMGRYVFTPAIFEKLERVQPGKGGEVQLTDAMAMLLDDDGLYGMLTTSDRFDTGDKLEYLKATVRLALRRPDLGPDFGAWLGAYVRDHGLLEQADR
ncbi:MAG: UTP--glucose-1-phosphate uridylyltransferase GalU [Acidimicrobiia bacterium]|nr:UTP--glucose-1-phosphate uridylyltransferase GalU [Acidimicrobiia bacterium]